MKNGDQYPTLAVTQAGRTFLGRRDSLTLTRPKRSSEVVSASKVTDLEYDQTLFEQLRSLREKFAERRVPSYIIFGDAALQEMAFYSPKATRASLVSTEWARKSWRNLATSFWPSSATTLTERPIFGWTAQHEAWGQPMRRQRSCSCKRSISAIAERRGFFTWRRSWTFYHPPRRSASHDGASLVWPREGTEWAPQKLAQFSDQFWPSSAALLIDEERFAPMYGQRPLTGRCRPSSGSTSSKRCSTHRKRTPCG